MRPGPVGQYEHDPTATKSRVRSRSYSWGDLRLALEGNGDFPGVAGEQCVSLYPRQHMVGADQIMCLTAGEIESVGLPSASAVVWILVLNPPRECPIAWSWPAFFRACTVLIGPHDGAVDHRIFIVSIGRQLLKDPLPDAGVLSGEAFFQSPKRSGKSRQGIPAR
jgi:hypothetical protein